jgi:hypothetical protein
MLLNHLSPHIGIYFGVNRVSSVTWKVTPAISMRNPSKMSVNFSTSIILNPWIFLQKTMHQNYSKDALTSVSSFINVKFWGSDPALLALCAPFLIFWEVYMVQHVFVLCAVDLALSQGRNIDQPGLARRTTNSA